GCGKRAHDERRSFPTLKFACAFRRRNGVNQVKCGLTLVVSCHTAWNRRGSDSGLAFIPDSAQNIATVGKVLAILRKHLESDGRVIFASLKRPDVPDSINVSGTKRQ